jgi:hypothetical protein
MGILIFFGLELIGVGILITSALFAKSQIAIVIWGIVAAILMALECIFLNLMAGVGSATSGQQTGYAFTHYMIAVSALALVIYFVVAPALLERRKIENPFRKDAKAGQE